MRDAEPLLHRQHRPCRSRVRRRACRRPACRGSLPDARSLFIGLHYSLAPLPARADGAAPRPTPRVGLFHQTRARLQRRPGAHAAPALRRTAGGWRRRTRRPTLSEPVKPITFWIDRNVPLEYRDDRTRGILEWNKAFEKIGFKDAIVVKQQPDDADFDTLDFGIASVRWMMNARARLRRHRPEPCGPAQRRDPRRRHRLREPELARAAHRCARRCWSRGAGRRFAERCWRRRPCWPACPARRRSCRTASWRPSSSATRWTCSRRAASSTPTARGPAVRAGLHQGHDRCTRSATRWACATTSAPRASTPSAAGRPRVHARQRHHRLGDGIQRHQPAAPGRARRRAVP